MPPGRVGNKAQRGDISVWLHPLVSKAQVFSDAPMCVCMGGPLVRRDLGEDSAFEKSSDKTLEEQRRLGMCSKDV